MSDEIIKRDYSVELEATGDGRTVDLRIVPYNTVARVSDGGPEYEEMWLPQCFDGQTNAAHRVDVLANFEHMQGINNLVGRGMELRESDESLDGTFRMLENANGDTMLELINSGHVRGVSLEAVAKKTLHENGIVKRAKARLVNIAFCRRPAFQQAGVLAVREAPEEEAVEAAPVSRLVPNMDLEERLERVGFETISRKTVVRKPWNPAADRFDDDEWKTACVLDRGDTFTTPKTRFGFPVLEPNGDLNVNGLHDAAQKLRTSAASPTAKSAAARRLVRYYRQAGETPSPGLLAAAAR